PLALDGIKVLDLSRVLAGPWSAQVLADLGAEVLKIERPGAGDDTRHWGPPFLEAADSITKDGAYFTCCNRNKRSVSLNFATPEGAEIIRAMAREADVLIENYKLGGLKKYGLDYESLRAENPALIYCSITGFSQTGPYAHRPGYDFVAQGMGGLMSITGPAEGKPGSEPTRAGVAICDLFTGMYAATSILAALHWRNTTGKGQHLDCALLASQVSMLANQGASYLISAETPGRIGNEHPTIVPYRVFAVENGHVIITCGNDGQYARLCAALGMEELIEDERFRTNEFRVINRTAIETIFEQALAAWPRDALLAKLEIAGVPCAPINTVSEVFSDPHVQHMGMRVDLRREDGTRVPTIAYPVRMSETPASYRSAPPALGADTETVLTQDLGLSPHQIAGLREKGII
ncbi:CaiB/BaiF CoA transferase family protein, partial [Cribrihabitans sp. XS_ASV171]